MKKVDSRSTNRVVARMGTIIIFRKAPPARAHTTEGKTRWIDVKLLQEDAWVAVAVDGKAAGALQPIEGLPRLPQLHMLVMVARLKLGGRRCLWRRSSGWV